MNWPGRWGWAAKSACNAVCSEKYLSARGALLLTELKILAAKPLAISAFATGVLLLCADVAVGQDYPVKPVRIITAEPGGNTDLVTRLLAEGLNLGQRVITQNLPTGIFAAETVMTSPPDGYTLLLQSSGFWIGPLIQKTSYDPVRDFMPITLTTNAPFFLYVHPSVPVATVKELIAFAKANPGLLNYGSSTIGATNHLAAELFNSMAGVNIVRVGYKGAGAAGIGLVSNQVQLMFGSGSFGMSNVKAGRLKVLGVGDSARSALAPDVPTITEAGLPGYEAAGMSGLWAPAKTPRQLVDRLNDEIVRVLARREIKERLLSVGIEAVGSSPEKAAAYVKSDVAKWARLIRDAGIGER
jgi:tripartite-type tricarboxylate transporter receptor subunit TctC